MCPVVCTFSHLRSKIKFLIGFFLMWAFTAINIYLSTTFSLFHKFRCVVFTFSLSASYFLIYFIVYSLTYYVFRSVLFSFYVFVDFVVFFLLLSSSFYPWCWKSYFVQSFTISWDLVCDCGLSWRALHVHLRSSLGGRGAWCMSTRSSWSRVLFTPCFFIDLLSGCCIH